MMFDSMICRISDHRVNRRRVWHDGVHFRTKCTRCDTPLIRDTRDGWRRFDEERDLAFERQPHPRNA